METRDIIILIAVPIVVSAITGTLASFIAPWANWGVEKKKKKLLWRKGFINECKRIIDKSRFRLGLFKGSANYASLKPNLSNKIKKDIDKWDIHPGRLLSRERRIKISMEEFRIKKALLDEITILENEWGLI